MSQDNVKKYILAIDEGTTGVTVLLVDEMGQPVAKANHEIHQYYPQPGWVEQDAEELFRTSISTSQEVLRKAGVSIQQVKGIGITGQRETSVVWDRQTGQPVRNAIVWQCRRTAPLCENLKQQGLGPVIQEKTGLIVDAYFSATKLRWILDNIPQGQKRAERGELLFGTVDSWLVWNLTGGEVHVTDFTNACRTMLFNIHTLQWDKELLSLMGVPEIMLPRVMPSSGVYGETVPGLFGAERIPIAAIAGDQQASLFGQACYEPGMAKNTYGTGSFVLLHTGDQPASSMSGLVSTIAWGLENKVSYALEGSIFVTGAAVQWLRDGLRLFENAAETENMALSVKDNAGVYFVPALVGLGAPHWDMYARGTIVGLTRGATREHLVRATLEAIAYQSRDVIQDMEQETGLRLPLLRVDGGGSANGFLMQFQADILGIPIQRTALPEVTALGAAYLAGLSVGFWKDLNEISRNWRAAAVYEPRMSPDERENLYHNWKRALNCAHSYGQSQ